MTLALVYSAFVLSLAAWAAACAGCTNCGGGGGCTEPAGGTPNASGCAPDAASAYTFCTWPAISGDGCDPGGNCDQFANQKFCLKWISDSLWQTDRFTVDCTATFGTLADIQWELVFDGSNVTLNLYAYAAGTSTRAATIVTYRGTIDLGACDAPFTLVFVASGGQCQNWPPCMTVTPGCCVDCALPPSCCEPFCAAGACSAYCTAAPGGWTVCIYQGGFSPTTWCLKNVSEDTWESDRATLLAANNAYGQDVDLLWRLTLGGGTATVSYLAYAAGTDTLVATIVSYVSFDPLDPATCSCDLRHPERGFPAKRASTDGTQFWPCAIVVVQGCCNGADCGSCPDDSYYAAAPPASAIWDRSLTGCGTPFKCVLDALPPLFLTLHGSGDCAALDGIVLALGPVTVDAGSHYIQDRYADQLYGVNVTGVTLTITDPDGIACPCTNTTVTASVQWDCRHQALLTVSLRWGHGDCGCHCIKPELGDIGVVLCALLYRLTGAASMDAATATCDPVYVEFPSLSLSDGGGSVTSPCSTISATLTE